MAGGGRARSTRTALVELTPTGNGLARGRVSAIQRARMLVAMAEVACERGASDVSVAHVVERAGVSRRTFYEIFEDREDCFLAAFEEAIVRATHYLSDAYDPKAEWLERVRSALEAILLFLEHEPVLGRLAVVESLGAGVKAREMRRDLLDRMVACVDALEERGDAGSSLTALTAEGVVGGVSSVIYGRLTMGDPVGLVEFVNPLMSMIVLPYLGPTAARRELERPVPKLAASRSAPAWNPMKGLDMRFTYRTVRVLSAVATNPGCSNRQIGEASGIGDQGQISKLLGRLEKLGLVERSGTRLHKGAANAWILTKQGEEVANVVATPAAHS